MFLSISNYYNIPTKKNCKKSQFAIFENDGKNKKNSIPTKKVARKVSSQFLKIIEE